MKLKKTILNFTTESLPTVGFQNTHSGGNGAQETCDKAQALTQRWPG